MIFHYIKSRSNNYIWLIETIEDNLILRLKDSLSVNEYILKKLNLD